MEAEGVDAVEGVQGKNPPKPSPWQAKLSLWAAKRRLGRGNRHLAAPRSVALRGGASPCEGAAVTFRGPRCRGV